MSELERAMQRVERWFVSEVDPCFFSPGATAPSGPLAALHARWNGQADERACFYEAFYLLDVEGAAREKQMMDRLAVEEGYPPEWWSLDWHPFATDIMGQLLVLDARDGSVREFIHDDEERPFLGASLGAFLSALADDLESGRRAHRSKCLVDVAAHEVMLRNERERARERAQVVAQHKRSAAQFVLALIAMLAVVVALTWWRSR